MIEAKELRIGNFVTAKEGVNVYEVDSIENIHDYFIGFKTYDTVHNVENIDPILLNEEWLLRFGFTHCNNNITELTLPIKFSDQEASIDICLNRNDEMGTVLSIRVLDYDLVSTIHIDTEYIHQLQNLHFTLTGEELKTVY